tara:strand:- start:166315 stop:168063 length:1749 start_codon:yes stop_codon:yes gene_type:complete
MTQAIGYIRRSTDRQEESLEQQRSQLEAFADSNGWKLKAVYCDDAISGSDLDRPGLQELLLASKSPDVDVVMAWDRNRIARPKDALDGLLIERKLQESGTRVVFAATGQETNNSFQSGLMSYVEHYQNGDYLRKLSRDTMRGTVDRAKRGLWSGGPPPFGFDRLILDGNTPKRIVRSREDGGQIVLDAITGAQIDLLPKGKSHKKQEHEVSSLVLSEPSRVRAVEKIFSDYAAGKPTRQLREYLNDMGFRTSRGNGFTVQTIVPMLENPAYIGRCVYNRRTLSKWHRYQNGSSVERKDEGIEKRGQDDWIICERAWPAIVDQDTFDTVQMKRKESLGKHKTNHRGNAMKSNYLLTGLMFCGVCGGKLTGATQTNSKGYRTRYYTCCTHQAGHKDRCPKRYSVPANLVEDHVLSLIRNDLIKLRNDSKLHKYVQDELRRHQGSQFDSHDQLNRRLADLDQKLAKLRDHLLSLDPATAESLGIYQQANDLSAERERVESELSKSKASVSFPAVEDLRSRIASEFDHLEEIMASGSLEERRHLIACYVNKIQAEPDRQMVKIGLYPTLFSQRIAGTGFEPMTSGL